MTEIVTLLSGPFFRALGWTLLHSLWQGSLIVASLGLVLLILRRNSPDVRYAASCLALCLILVFSSVTCWVVYEQTASPATVSSFDGAAQVALQQAAAAGDLEFSGPWQSAIHTEDLIWKQSIHDALERLVPWLTLLWLVGVSVLFVRLAGAWCYAEHLRRTLVRPVADSLQERFKRLLHTLGLQESVMLLESPIVDVPTVIGVFRPVVLLPASALTGLTPSQLEAILAHELAHIRRRDFLVNLLQSIVETIFFFHPAVWWVSRQIRIERELCCDDMAVAVCGDSRIYARALAELEAVRRKVPRLAVLTAVAGSLATRIYRLVGLPVSRPSVSAASLTVGAVTVALAALIALGTFPTVAADASNHAAGEEAADIWITAIGQVQVNTGREDAIVIHTGGRFILEERQSGTSRKVEIAHDHEGELTWRYFTQHEERTFDAAAQAWLSKLLRQPHVHELLAKALQHQDVLGIYSSSKRHGLGRVSLIQTGSQAMTNYPEHYLQMIRWRLAAISNTEPQTDGKRAHWLHNEVRQNAQLAAHGLITDTQLQQVLLGLVESIGNYSTYEGLVGEVLHVTTEFMSDQQKAEFLSSIAPILPNLEEVHTSYRKAAHTLASEALRAEALVALEKRESPVAEGKTD